MNILTTLAQTPTYYDNPYNRTFSSSSSSDFLYIFIFFLIVFVAIYVFRSVCLMSIFKKAGAESWIAWVPIFNNWKLLEIGGQKGYWAILELFPLIGIVAAVFLYIAMYNIGLKLGKSGGFVLLAIFFQIVWLPWLAFDSSTWDESAGAPTVQS